MIPLVATLLPHDASVFRKLLVITVIGLFAGYVLMINHLAISGHRIQDLSKKIQTVRSETEQLKDAVFQLESLSSIQKKALDLDMVPVGTARFMSQGEGKSVAQR